MENVLALDLLALQTQVKNAGNLLEDYGRDVDNVKTLQDQILAAPLAATDAEQELATLTTKIQLQNELIRDELLYIRNYLARHGSSGLEEMETIQRQFDSLRRIFTQFATTFKSNQTSFRDDCKIGLQTHLKSSETEFSEEEVDKMIEAGSFSQCISNEAELHEKHQHYLAEAGARHRSLAKVQTSLNELHDVMAKFNAMLETQEENLEESEYRIALESKNLEDAKEKLKQATMRLNG